MIELMIGKTSLRLDFTFFAVMSLYFLTESSELIAGVAACVIHEMSHLVVMKLLHVPIKEVLFYGAGIRISAVLDTSTCAVKTSCLAAGVAANSVVCAVAFAMDGYLFSAVNLVTGMFNLLPVGEFDGAQLLRMLLLRYSPPERIDSVMKLAGCVAILLCSAIIFMISMKVRPVVLGMLIYLFIIVLIS